MHMTEWRNDRQEKNNMPPDLRSRGPKNGLKIQISNCPYIKLITNCKLTTTIKERWSKTSNTGAIKYAVFQADILQKIRTFSDTAISHIRTNYQLSCEKGNQNIDLIVPFLWTWRNLKLSSRKKNILDIAQQSHLFQSIINI